LRSATPEGFARRAFAGEFPDDPGTYDLADEAMLGPYLLVAPAVIEGATSRAVYLPAGRWFEWGTDRVFDGPTTIDVALRTPALPMFAREGAIIPATDAVEIYGAGGSFTRFDDPGTTTISTAMGPSGIDVTSSSPITPRIHAPAGTSVEVAFEVHVPASTTGTIYVASSATGWTHVPLAWVAPGVARGTLAATPGDWIDYKYTRGSWDTVEKAGDCSERPDRARLAGPRIQIDRVRTWRDGCQ
jgi:hypothetical protein